MRAGDLLFVSGQIGTTEDDAPFVGDFGDEVTRALDNVERVLAAHHASMSQVVKVGAFLSQAALFERFNAVYAHRFTNPPPARTTVVVAFGLSSVRVEIDAVAYLGR
jgi:2-iminobutanoate/2-iminopropanoate deaminase